MLELFAMDELVMMGIVLFASFWLFLFNYRMDNKEKYEGHKWLIGLVLIWGSIWACLSQDTC